MFNLIKSKPVATVEEIHAEFDSAQERLLQECDEILNELQIPTETKVERKAAELEGLGFVNSETVVDYQDFKRGVKDIETRIEYTDKQAREIRELAFKYPLEKFITVEEMDRICDKYNLIHAPVNHYVKDVPEKNVLEMANRKPLEELDGVGMVFDLKGVIDTTLLDRIGLGTTFSESDIWSLSGLPDWRKNKVIEYLKDGSDSGIFTLFYNLDGFPSPSYNQYSFSQCRIIDKTGLQVAAPKSHFNLKGLKKMTKFGFFNVREVEVKDPVVFEYCKNDIVRIITKWGTDDDQSYLDEALQNPITN